MNKSISKYLLVCFLILGVVVWWQQRHIVQLGKKRDRYQGNTEALLSDMKRMQVDSATTAVDVKSLRLTVDEYKRLRAEDAEMIKRLGVKVKNLEAAARHELDISGPIHAVVRDTVVMRDTLPVKRQKVEMVTPYIQLTGLIENECLKGEIKVPVTLHQGIWIEYKRRWIFWKKVKAVHQSISSDNPYVKIRYSEYIQIQE